MGPLGSSIVYAKGFSSQDFPDGPQSFTEDEWVEAFHSRYSFWVLRVAENLLEGDRNSGFQKDPDSGFAVLLILFSYFEMIARHQEGQEIKPYSRGFGKGVEDVFKDELVHVFEKNKSGYELKACRLQDSTNLKRKVIDHLWKNLRNELAHAAFTGKDVSISGNYPVPITVLIDKGGNVTGVGLNPHLWVKRVRDHFENYVDTLRKQANTIERKKFLRYAKRYL